MDDLVTKLQSRIKYDKSTGELRWKYRPDMPDSFNRRWAGRLAFTTKTSDGFRKARIDGLTILAHRAAWAIYYGEYRTDIFYADNNKLNNTIVNLKSHSYPPYGYPDSFISYLEALQIANKYLVRCV